MKKIYYPDFKQKKECMKKLVKKAPEYKGIKIKIWILAVLCPIVGIAISAWLVLSPNYWTLVNEGPGNFYIFIATMLFLMCPGFALATWNKRFYTCCADVYMQKYLQFEQTEEEIRFMEFIFDHNVKALFGIAVPFIIVKNFKNRETSTGHYEMSGVRIELDKSKLLLKYDRQENRMEFKFSRLTSVEYSEQLEAVRIVGYENISKNVVEHILYLERGKEQEFLDKFAEYSGLQVHNMDQKQEN